MKIVQFDNGKWAAQAPAQKYKVPAYWDLQDVGYSWGQDEVFFKDCLANSKKELLRIIDKKSIGKIIRPNRELSLINIITTEEI